MTFKSHRGATACRANNKNNVIEDQLYFRIWSCGQSMDLIETSSKDINSSKKL